MNIEKLFKYVKKYKTDPYYVEDWKQGKIEVLIEINDDDVVGFFIHSTCYEHEQPKFKNYKPALTYLKVINFRRRKEILELL
jgi:hypothetical protein